MTTADRSHPPVVLSLLSICLGLMLVVAALSHIKAPEKTPKPSAVSAKTSPAPVADDSVRSVATFTSRQVSHTYPGTFPPIRKIDFRNFELLTFDDTGKPTYSTALRNGHFLHKEPGDYHEVDLESVHYLNGSPSSASDFALALLSHVDAGGSSYPWAEALVFRTSGGKLEVVQEINWSTEFYTLQPYQSFHPKTNTLVIRSAHYIGDDADCCISAMDVVTYRWDGAQFVQTGVQTELSDLGKEEGVTLPASLTANP